MSSGKKQESERDVFIEALEFKFMKGFFRFLICWTVWKLPELAKKSHILAENIVFYIFAAYSLTCLKIFKVPAPVHLNVML